MAPATPFPIPQAPAKPEAGIFPAVCSWCHTQYRAGNPDLPITHGICDDCAEVWRGHARAAKVGQ